MAESGRSEANQQDSAFARGSTARRIVLGAALRRLREQAGISRADAGYMIRSSDSKVSRIELGRVAFKERDVADLLTMYGITDAGERESFLDMVRHANQPGWWRRFNDVMPHWFQDFVGLEESAARIQAYELQFVPGLLQTEAYARAIATRGRPEFAPPDTDRRIRLRMQRQRILTGVNPTKLWVVLDESVLRRPIGGRQVLRKQLEHLLEASQQPNIAVQVVPMYLSGYAAEGSFTILRFTEPELPDVVYVEHLAGAIYVDTLDEIEQYGRALDRLAVDAETPDRSRQLITKALQDLSAGAPAPRIGRESGDELALLDPVDERRPLRRSEDERWAGRKAGVADGDLTGRERRHLHAVALVPAEAALPPDGAGKL